MHRQILMTKDGEIALVRTKLNDKQEHELQERLAAQLKVADEEKAALRLKHEKEIQRMKTELLFKDQELRQMENLRRSSQPKVEPKDEFNPDIELSQFPTKASFCDPIIDNPPTGKSEAMTMTEELEPSAKPERSPKIPYKEDTNTMPTLLGHIKREMSGQLQWLGYADTLDASCRQQYELAVNSLMQNLCRLVSDTCLSLTIILLDVESVVDLCLRNDVFQSLPYFLHLLGLALMLSADCRNAVMTPDAPRHCPRLFSQLIKLLRILALRDKWKRRDQLVPLIAEPVFTSLLSLASTVESEHLRK
ncbi:hypothetical protein HK104_002190 [Borealophlyctis nickersoniae]|nr:hypothetical protein HK104_002190 [Borealophlyctis nickersoniae]